MTEYYLYLYPDEEYCIVFYGTDRFDTTSPSACTWIVPGTILR